jgi:hypothetical protein
MKNYLNSFLKAINIAILASVFSVSAQTIDPLKEYRYCGTVQREENGTISRSNRVINAYKKIHPCPSTGMSIGACPGWAIDHIIPLANGGCDSVVNMAWMPNQIKSCSSQYCIDRWERKYYGNPTGIITFDPMAK